MRYSNRNFTFLPLQLFILLCLSLPALADDIVITRKAAPGKALLDRKFIFMQEANSFAKNSQPIVKSPKLHTINNLTPTLTTAKLPITKNKSLPRASAKTQPAQDNWDAYAEDVTDELEESLSVGARLLN